MVKFIVLTILVAILSLSDASAIGQELDEVVESVPQYEFHYSVHDIHTGDVKDQFEHRRGDYVTGRYALIDPDGYRRIVEYSSEPHIGFSAHVRREPV